MQQFSFIYCLFQITDSAPTSVHQMLTYMYMYLYLSFPNIFSRYSGGLPDDFSDDQASGLIEISDKYGLEPLKIICQDKLISRFIDNLLTYCTNYLQSQFGERLCNAYACRYSQR
jgi:hypothetical protein